MSAFMCSTATLKLLAVWAAYDKTPEECSRIANELQQANWDSLIALYGDQAVQGLSMPEVAITLEEIQNFQGVAPAQVLKSAVAFDYQACEVDDYQSCEAQGYTLSARDAAARALPGYDHAAWAY